MPSCRRPLDHEADLAFAAQLGVSDIDANYPLSRNLPSVQGCAGVTCIGEPLRVPVCHGLNCQKRSGSAFAVEARFPTGNVHVGDETTDWSPDGDREARTTFRFCPRCGALMNDLDGKAIIDR